MGRRQISEAVQAHLRGFTERQRERAVRNTRRAAKTEHRTDALTRHRVDIFDHSMSNSRRQVLYGAGNIRQYAEVSTHPDTEGF